jgi:hypothetical protein
MIPVSFGDIGEVLYGKYMRFAVLVAITFSQVCFLQIKFTHIYMAFINLFICDKYIYISVTDGVCVCIYGVCIAKCPGSYRIAVQL